MRIAFVTGCLAAGKDGVGDYTRLLAEECVRRGHTCRLLSLHDGYIYGSRSTESSAGQTLQFGRNTPWRSRISVGRSFLRDFDPECISLQYVPYGFDRRGLNLALPRFLDQLTKGYPVHLMLHELWVGAHRGATWRLRVTGVLQKFLLRQTVDRIRPSSMHTSNETYIALLKTAGMQARRLPMFGAVPLAAQDSAGWCLHELGNTPLTAENRSRYWIVGMFGALHPIWPPEPVLTRLHQLAGREGKQLIVASIGRLGAGEGLWERCTQTYKGRIHFCRLGEQSPPRLADFMQTIDFGLATSPASLIGKSSSVAAMLDHGVPVIVNRDDIRFDGVSINPLANEPLLIGLDGRFSERLRAAKKQPPRPRLAEVVSVLLNEFAALPIQRAQRPIVKSPLRPAIAGVP